MKKLQEELVKIEDRSALEGFGEKLTTEQMIDLLSTTLAEEKQQWKLSPLLVGFPHKRFLELLNSIPSSMLELFKHESVTEPIQHQLTLLTHDIQQEINKKQMELKAWEKRLEALAIDEMSREDAKELIVYIDTLEGFFSHLENLVNKALAIGWNTGRTELIDSLNSQKELTHRYLFEVIGNPRDLDNLPTGLYAIVETALFRCYGEEKDIEAVRDDEPALEGLAKLSVWYLRDYFLLGLLPSIKTENDLETDGMTEDERTDFRQKIFEEAENSLTLMGLKTVWDLKREWIFSIKTLKEFLLKKRKN